MRAAGAIALAVLLALAGCGRKQDPQAGAGAPADEAIVRIGHVAPLSGPQARYGHDDENGVRMAIADLNHQHLQIAGRRLHFEIASEDDAGDPALSPAAAQKLCNLHVKGVIGPLGPDSSIPSARIYHDCGIPHITPSAGNPDLTKPGYATTYRLVANDNEPGAALAVYAADALKLRTVAVIDDRTRYGEGVADMFKRAAHFKGLQVVEQQSTSDQATDFLALLSEIKARNPDAIFYGGLEAQAGPMLHQMDQLGMDKMRFFGGEGICTPQLAKLSGNAKSLAGVVCATSGAGIDRMPGGTAWKQRYDQQFPGDAPVYSPYAYDATFVLVDAMKRAHSVEPRLYLPFLATTDYHGVTARIRFEPNGELKNAPTTLFTYMKGVRTPL